MDKVKRHQEIVTGLTKLYADKNADYGDSVHETFKMFGYSSYLTRIYDKFHRLTTLTRNEDNRTIKDESIRDTFLDLANYAILAIIEMDCEEEARKNNR